MCQHQDSRLDTFCFKRCSTWLLLCCKSTGTKKKKKHFAWALIGVCCFSLWFEASACSEDPRHVLGNQSPSCLAGRNRADITLKPKLKGFSRALSCMCSGWLMFEWDFISNSCLCSLIPILLGGTLLYRLPFWCFRAAPKHPRLVCYSKHIIHHSEKSIKRTITSEKIGPLLRARDGCLSRLSQGEGCRKLLMRLKKICVHSGGKEFVIRLLQSVKLLSHSVRNMKNLPRNTLSSFFNTCSLKRHCRIQFFSGILQVQVFLVLLGECSGAFFITLLWQILDLAALLAQDWLFLSSTVRAVWSEVEVYFTLLDWLCGWCQQS